VTYRHIQHIATEDCKLVGLMYRNNIGQRGLRPAVSFTSLGISIAKHSPMTSIYVLENLITVGMQSRQWDSTVYDVAESLLECKAGSGTPPSLTMTQERSHSPS